MSLRKRDNRYKYPRKDYAARIRTRGNCPVCGKHMFATRADARAEARRLEGEAGHSGLRAYKCNGYFHLTSESTERITAFREDFQKRQRGG